MSVATRDRVPRRRRSRTRALLIAAPLFLASTPSVADSPRDSASLDSTHLSARPDETRHALLRALAAYSAGDVAMAQSWTGRAKALLDRAPRPDDSQRKWITGNSDQLLRTLEVYAEYAYGRHLELDAEFDLTVARLRRIDFVNRSRFGTNRRRDATMSIDAFTHLVTRLGDLVIDYDPFTLQITRLGDLRIDYNAFTRLPERIGAIGIHYDPFNGRLTRIADVNLQ